MHSKVFDRYERVEEDTEKILGTGLGLTLVKSLVEKLGGSVSLKSNEGKGTSFYVTIPVEIKEEKNEIIKETNYREKLEGNVLLVEDNELVHEMTKDMLEKIGFTIFSAKKIENAVEMINSTEFDLIITDLYLPDGKGTDILNKIKEMKIETKSILMTASILSEEEKKNVNSDLVLYKPIRTSDFYKEIYSLFLESKIDVYKEYLLNLNMSSEQIREIIKISYSETEEMLINAKLDEKFEEYKKAIHKFKGSISFWGNDNLIRLAENLEKFYFEDNEKFMDFIKVLRNQIADITNKI